MKVASGDKVSSQGAHVGHIESRVPTQVALHTEAEAVNDRDLTILLRAYDAAQRRNYPCRLQVWQIGDVVFIDHRSLDVLGIGKYRVEDQVALHAVMGRPETAAQNRLVIAS